MAPTEILLTTQNMVFFLYNLLGHDIVHDAHPNKLGKIRFPETFANLTGTKTVKITSSSSLAGGQRGGGDDDEYEIDLDNLEDLEYLENEENKPITDNSKKDIIYSIGEELISKRMLFGTRSFSRRENTIWQNKTFLIIDIPYIVNVYTKKQNSTSKINPFSIARVNYPGNIYYNGKIINPLDIEVSVSDESSSRPTFIVKWSDDTSYYKVTFNSGIKLETTKSADINYINDLTLREFSDETYTTVKKTIQFELICPGGDQRNTELTICEEFKDYYTELGDDFFYDAFTDYMRNETYYNVEGYDDIFIKYIFSNKNVNNNNDKKAVEDFLEKFDSASIKNKERELYQHLKSFYDYFKDKFSIFLEYQIPEFDQNSLNNVQIENKNKYLSVLAQIVGTFINNDPNKFTLYQDKIKSVLNYFSCNSEINQVKDFLSVCKFYTVQQKTIKLGGGKNNNLYKQRGGDYISSIMSRAEKEALLAYEPNPPGVNSLIPEKWNNFIKDAIVTYTGLEETKINNYIDNIGIPPSTSAILLNPSSPQFYYENILNISFTLADPTPAEINYLGKVEDTKFSLFNVNSYYSTILFYSEIKDTMDNPGTTLENFVMPTGVQIVMPLFTDVASDPSEDIFNIPSVDKPKAIAAIKKMYDFEQAFIVQLKVFLFYGYTKRIQKPGSSGKKLIDEADEQSAALDSLLTTAQKNGFFQDFKINFNKYLEIYKGMIGYGLLQKNKSGKKEYLKQKFGELSSIQEVNSGYIVSSSVAVMSYCLKEITTASPPPVQATLLLAQIEMLNKICLKSNLDKASGAGSVDEDLLDNFKEYIKNSTGDFTGTSKYKIRDKEFAVGDMVEVKNKENGTISKINTKDKNVGAGKNKKTIKVTDEDNYEVKVGSKILKKIKKGDLKYVMPVQDLIKQPPKPPNTNNLYYINNAVSYSEVPKFFCPFSSIIDGQSTCNSYNSALTGSNPNPIEEGEIDVIVRDGNPVAYSPSGTIATTGETMRYHVKVQKGSGAEWTAADDGIKTLKISAYLKIKDNVLINIGNVAPYANHVDKDRQSINTPISVDLNGKTSPLEAKVCIKEMMETAVELLSSDPTGSILKKWDDYLKIIDGTTTTQINTSKTTADPDTQISPKLFRRKIIEASFKKSLGDYLQEINTVAENGGYISGSWVQKGTSGLSVLAHPGVRLGLSNDRPSGVRAAFLILFGKSGINPNSIAGYMGPSGDYVLAARNKANFAGGSSIEKYKIYNKVSNNTKRRKIITKKRKILFKKNRKISKRNNKGTRKRK
jgi:hypothetical protein